MATSERTQKSDLDRNIDRVSQSAHQAVDRAAAAASGVVEGISAKGQDLLEMPENWLEGAREYVRENPWAAIGMAVAAGYLLHMITRSK
jgi:ElaB/YqjD/DUF883 family membrane-anchored ribosome-binding protein